jgi:Holliday junction resolvase
MTASRSEASVVKAVLRYLRSIGAKAIKTTPPGVEAGTPDILACWRGRMLAIECKRADIEPSKLQMVRLRQWSDAGAITLLVWNVAQVQACLTLIDEADKVKQ